MRATIVGAVDRRLQEILMACGVRATARPEADLLALVRSGLPSTDIIVLDVRGQTRVPQALAALRRQHPRTPIVLVVSSLEPMFILEAMRAGASECLVEPLTQAEVQAAIGRVAAHLGSTVNGQVFAFLGAKGGVGTTTAAVNVATELARVAPGATLMMDLHLAYGDAAVFLGAEPRFSTMDAIENTDKLDEAFFRSLVVRTKHGLDLLASSDRAMTIPVDVARINQVVEFAARHYQYSILDVPRSEPAVLDGLEAVKTIVVVANQELATVRSAGRIAATLRQRYGKERVRVVVSRYDRRAEIGQDDVQRAVGGSITHVFPSDYRVALEAMNTGRPLVLGNHNRLSASFAALARDLAGLDASSQPVQPAGGLFERFTGRRRS
jgi:pilus assembly protein CpaE